MAEGSTGEGDEMERVFVECAYKIIREHGWRGWIWNC